MKFGTGGRLADIINCFNFLSIGEGVSDLQGVEFCHSPLTWAVTVNTGLRYHAFVTTTAAAAATATATGACAGCMGMMALGREDQSGQLRVADQGGIQPLVRLLRLPRTSSQVLLADVCALASLCIGLKTLY